MAKLKKILKENFSVVGGMVSVPAVNAGYGSLTQLVKEKYGEQTQKVSSEQVKEALKIRDLVKKGKIKILGLDDAGFREKK